MSKDLFISVESSLKALRKEIASIKELDDTQKDIDGVIENINSPLTIMVMGEFSTGKSTFINALVGDAVTKVGAKPTTAVITKLTYGAADQITVFFRDGSTKNYDEESFAVLTAEGDEKANSLHEGIDYVEKALPLDMLKSVSIIDSPGLNSIKAVHEETTKSFIDKADTVIWLFDANKPGSQTEFDALKRLNPRLSPLCIVNKIDAIDEDEGDTLEKIIDDIERKLANNRLECQKIIGISAKLAFKGKNDNNEKMTAASNIGDFYHAIDTMVLPNREQYKRNSMLDGLASVVFSAGNTLHGKQEENNRQKSSNYAAYIETETSLASSFDELENIADIVMSAIESTQSPRRKKLNSAEKTFYGVLYWLGLFVEKDADIAQQYLEESAIRSDAIAQRILADVYSSIGEIDKATYWYNILGMKPSVQNIEDMLHKGESYAKGEGVEQDYAKAMEWFQKAADGGSSAAMEHIGSLYYDGYGVQKDYEEALKWFRKAADAGNVEAMNYIGYFYQNGYGVTQDYVEAMKWYRQSADLGYSDAIENIGTLYFYGYGVQKDYEESLKWLRKAADARNVEAIVWIASFYQNGYGVNQDYVEAMKWYRQAAELGNGYAMYWIGEFYREGFGVTKDNDEAIKWYRKSADTGETGAIAAIGYCYHHGCGVTQDYVEAMKWYRKAADLGFVAAMQNIGVLYYFGFGVQKDYEKALKWFRKSADAGNDAAMSWIGLFYQNGYGVNLDYAEAMKWYRQAADAGNADAMYLIGELYRNGFGVAKQNNEALKWYRKSADKGEAHAIAAIGYSYHEGCGVAQDYVEAMKWYRQAADLGFIDVMKKIGELYYAGSGVQKDYEEALKYFRKGADAGDGEAMTWIGLLYQNGYGVNVDYVEAMKWYRKGADAGDVDAIYYVGLFYENGLGIESDDDEALVWYVRAADAGHDYAKKKISEIKSRKLRNLKASNGCFITTAVCENFNKPDNCYELTMFRNFRDKWLSKQADGAQLINEYYHVAPSIVENINQNPDAEEIYAGIWSQYLHPCLHYIESGDNMRCKELYISMVNHLRIKFETTL